MCISRNSIPDFGADVMAEALAMAKPIYKIPIIPLPSSSQYRHQDHVELKDYRTKVRVYLIVPRLNLGYIMDVAASVK